MITLLNITNATKAQIIVVINAIFGVLGAFHLVLTQTQLSAIEIAVNAVLGLLVSATYTQSRMRLKHPRDKPLAGK